MPVSVPLKSRTCSVGRYGQLDMERLLSSSLDLLLLWPGSVGPAQREQLKNLNIPTYVAEPHELDQLNRVRLPRNWGGRSAVSHWRRG